MDVVNSQQGRQDPGELFRASGITLPIIFYYLASRLLSLSCVLSIFSKLVISA